MIVRNAFATFLHLDFVYFWRYSWECEASCDDMYTAQDVGQANLVIPAQVVHTPGTPVNCVTCEVSGVVILTTALLVHLSHPLMFFVLLMRGGIAANTT